MQWPEDFSSRKKTRDMCKGKKGFRYIHRHITIVSCTQRKHPPTQFGALSRDVANHCKSPADLGKSSCFIAAYFTRPVLLTVVLSCVSAVPFRRQIRLALNWKPGHIRDANSLFSDSWIPNKRWHWSFFPLWFYERWETLKQISLRKCAQIARWWCTSEDMCTL